MRTHLILPEEMVKEVDALVGKRKRSQFVGEAVREKLRRENLLAALAATAGILSAEDYPEWATSEEVAAWVHDMRQRDDERLER
ncbi:MAG: ribbon-helix-helix domain-containing protein [Dehalococcoidia bacterium]|nr:ribbon-helix-helix domain-containing protein [Dehalococcoidia bacterium]